MTWHRSTVLAVPLAFLLACGGTETRHRFAVFVPAESAPCAEQCREGAARGENYLGCLRLCPGVAVEDGGACPSAIIGGVRCFDLRSKATATAQTPKPIATATTAPTTPPAACPPGLVPADSVKSASTEGTPTEEALKVGAPIVPWDSDKNGKPPPGYHVETRMEHPEEAFFGGLAFGLLYAAHVSIAIASKDEPGTNWFYVPIVGPIGYPFGCKGRDCELVKALWPYLILDSMLQAAAAVVFVRGMFSYKTILVRSAPMASWDVLPRVHASGGGLDLVVRF